MRLYYFDDSGSRTANKDQPYFVLGGFGISALDLPVLRAGVTQVANSYGMSLRYPVELKASHAGNLKKQDANWMLKAGLSEISERRALLLTVLRHLGSIPSVKCIAVVAKNQGYAPKKARREDDQSNIIVDTMPLAMERVELDLQDHREVGCVFLDEERGHEPGLRDAFRDGSAFVRRERIVESVAFLPSEESVGVQVADIIAGGVSRWVNSTDPGYARHIWPHLRKYNGKIQGAGLKTMPYFHIDAPPDTADWEGSDRKTLEEMYRRTNKTLRWENGWPINSEGHRVRYP